MTGTGKRLAPDARRRQLIEVALEVFARQGYEDADLEQVAADAGVRRSLLYHYFPGAKPELFLAALTLAGNRLVEHLETDQTEAPDAKLPRNLTRFLDLVEDDDPAMSVVRQARRLEATRNHGSVRAAAEALARGMALNRLGVHDPSPPVLVTFMAFVGFYEVALDEWLAGTITRPELEDVISRALRAVAAEVCDLQGPAG